MKAGPFALSLALALPLATPVAAQPIFQPQMPMPPYGATQPGYTLRDARIVAITIPQAGSGIFHFYARAQVRTPDGVDHQLNWTWLGGDQFRPPVGSVCDFTFHYEAWRRPDAQPPAIDYNRPALVVTGYRCDTGTDPMTGPPDPRPVEPPRPWALGVLRPVTGLSTTLLPALEELPLALSPGLPEGLRFRAWRATVPGPSQSCAAGTGCGQFLYILVWRDGWPSSVLLQTSMATVWRDVRIEGSTLAGDRLDLRASAEGSWPAGTRRLPLSAEIGLPGGGSPFLVSQPAW